METGYKERRYSAHWVMALTSVTVKMECNTPRCVKREGRGLIERCKRTVGSRHVTVKPEAPELRAQASRARSLTSRRSQRQLEAESTMSEAYANSEVDRATLVKEWAENQHPEYYDPSPPPAQLKAG
ncbi:hypothetical protein EVAR_9932_1 [Eumeta japonica]|uniref:Uncharacterized protein n=1 Tax=Eumeta variegata TaxID=151549 RepID=A0A4C1TQU0_EUMVA|nr:hypothetical protein EVAR_9932_1 [Eumeta japonica]